MDKRQGVKMVRRLLVWFAWPLLLGSAYVVYLAAGGGLGREAIKSALARVQTSATYTLRAGDGGDCSRIGTWNQEASTCTLVGDTPADASIFIRDSGIVLDGGGYTMTGNDASDAVTMIGIDDGGVRNLNIVGYDEGVYLQHAKRNVLDGITVKDCSGHGIQLLGEADFNAIVNNNIAGCVEHGVALWSSHGNLIANNEIDGVRDGVRFQSSTGNVVTLNSITRSEIEGVDLHISKANRIFMNDVIKAPVLMLDDLPVGSNLFHLLSGGNYYGTEEQMVWDGCQDLGGDGYCDSEFTFIYGRDPMPFVEPVRTRFLKTQ